MTLSTLAPTISASGITAPTYADILASLQQSAQAIYGADVYLEPDSKDGQLLAVFAKAISDSNAVAIAVYQSFSPNSAQGAALSSNVKINGIRREAASYSSADLTIVGQAGAPINNGIAKDANGNQWTLPASVTIPATGQIIVTATCTAIGAIMAPAGTINQIGTPMRGWQSVTNASDASVGAPVESDAALRQRQTHSTANPSLTVLDGIIGAVQNIAGVTRCIAFENDTDETDDNGLPSHTISLVVEGGDAAQIASAICLKKTPGTGTYGTTSQITTDPYGRPLQINFFRPAAATISVAVAIKALPAYTSATGTALQQAVVDYINGIEIGGGDSGNVEWDSCVSAAKGVSGGNTFRITSLTLSGPRGAGSPDVALLFNEAALCSLANVQLTVS
ncbi:putative phage protein gp47/JayE [Paraburkholderia caballeronis]|uniref:baseplate J/gp47 family protein n=1 Tax=Paraburkholderia caballeronis TaxID=416943 RepID=UPI0010649990|nr:baseplate J/gp47 family protein [Paraburkholderia caballeronis]TDV39518.1 putative phage protein gp47/JayE [Paraburkholderia caballeronis]